MSPRNKRFTKTHGVRGQNYGIRYVDSEGVKIAYYYGPENSRKRKVVLVSKVNTAAERERADRILEEAFSAEQPKEPDWTLGMLLTAYRDEAPHRHNPKTAQALRPKTLSAYDEYQRAIARSGLDLSQPAAGLKRSHVREWVLNQQRAGLAAGTIARRVDYLKAAYRWAVADVERLEADPLQGFKSPSRKGKNLPYTEAEGRALFETVLALPSRAWRFKLVALLTSAYGVRSLQAMGCRWADFDLDKVTTVPTSKGEAQLIGTVTFRQDVEGSKGQPDRTMPLLPFVREVVLEAHRHRRGDVVCWSWRNAAEPCPYGSMNHQLKKLERRAGVRHIPGRAFHAFRRALSNELVKTLGVLQASGWIADTPEVLMRSYVSATERETLEAAEYLIRRFTEDPKPAANRQSDREPVSKSFDTNTGAGGFEPPTCHPEQSSFSDKTIPLNRFRPRKAV